MKKKGYGPEHSLSHDPMAVQAGKALMEEMSGLLKEHMFTKDVKPSK